MDQTEDIRRTMVAVINAVPGSREALEQQYGDVWDTKQLQELFQVQGFAAPLAVVRRKEDGAVGTVMFQHMPRFYFNFELDES